MKHKKIKLDDISDYLKDKRIYWSRTHNPNKWEKPKVIKLFSSKLARVLEKVLNKFFS